MNTANFSIHRLLMFAKSEIISQKRMWLLWWGAICAIMLVFYSYYSFVIGHQASMIGDIVADGFSPLVGVRQTISTISTFVAVILISRSFGGYLKPRSASQLLLFPISKVERFTFVAIFYMVFIPLMLFVTQFVIDFGFAMYYNQPNLLQSLFSTSLSDGPHVDGEVSLDEVYAFNKIFSFFATLALLSIFLFGAILFRRNNFVMTCLAIFGVTMVLFFMALSLGNALMPDDGSVSLDTNFTTARIVTVSIAAILSIIMLFLSYRRFRNFQITK